MSSFAPDVGDAVRPDGTLKDASEINWSYDADESIPFPSDNASGPSSGHAPATVVASVRRTTRISRPSRRVLDALEAEAAESASRAPAQNARKRKAISPLPDQRAHKNVVNVISDNDSDNGNNSNNNSDGGTPSPPPTEPASDDYESLQAMADADNLVRSLPRRTISFLLI
jgi:hypothetical protein